ncbi:sodium:proline symporter [Alicyclobacillus acidoterrestris]|nr:sodium:proline symporter [Alicyclobacillus acidoterrestris]
MTIKVVLVMYMVVLVILGIFSARRVHSESDYLVAGRGLGTVLLGVTLPATQMSAGTAIGTVGYIAFYGYQYDWFWVALWGGWFISLTLIAPKMWAFGQRNGSMTMPDVLGARFGNAMRIISAIVILVCFLLLFSAEYEGAATVFQLVFGISYVPCVLIVALIVLVYALLGGLFSIARNDLLQMAVFLVGYVAASLYALHAVGGMTGLQTHLQRINPELLKPLGNKLMPVGTLIGLSLATMVTFIAYPLDSMKFFSATKKSTLRRAIWIGILMQVIIGFCIAVIGAAGRVILPNFSKATMDDVAPYIALHTMPPVLGALLMAAVLGAVMAVSSSIIMVVSSAFCHDIYPFIPSVRKRSPMTEKGKLRFERSVSLIVAILGVMIAIRPLGPVSTIVTVVQQFMASTLAVAMISALNWKRASVSGGIASIIGGFIGVLGWFLMGSPFALSPVYCGLLFSILGMVVFSLRPAVTPAPSIMEVAIEDTSASL